MIGPGRPLLRGIVGSVAHGLAHAGSDVDRAGVYAAPTLRILDPWADRLPPAYVDHTIAHSTEQDPTCGCVTYWEAERFVMLLSACNPTAMELLWLPTELYEEITPDGQQLLDLRSDVLNVEQVRKVYTHYLHDQTRRLSATPVSDPTRLHSAQKLARHGIRIAQQGLTLLRTGRLVVRDSDPQSFRRFDPHPWDALPDLNSFQHKLMDEPSFVLPAQRTDTALDSLKNWLLSLRISEM